MKQFYAGFVYAAAAALLVAVVGGPAALARSELPVGGAKSLESGTFIVRLTSAPTPQFRGGTIETFDSDGRKVSKRFAPTALEVTGAQKLDVDVPAVVEYAAHLDAERGDVLGRAELALGRALKPKHVYRHVLNGFAIEITAAEAEALAAVPGVRSVEREFVHYPMTDNGPEWIGADRYWAGQSGVVAPNRGEGTVIGVVDTGINWDSFFFDPARPGAPQIDNPRGQFYGLCSQPSVLCSDKIIGVYDFTDEGTNGKDPDSHGSHVASTAAGFPLSFSLNIAGQSIFFSTSGVAPNASIISYKACEDNPDRGTFTCSGSDTSAALEQAIVDQVDSLNYSIGGAPFDPWAGIRQGFSTSEEIFLNMRAAGIAAVTSAGNFGNRGEGWVGSPANAPWAFSVANVTHDRVLANRLFNVSGGDFVLGALTGLGQTGGTNVVPIVYAGDFGNALCGTGEAELGSSCGQNTGATNPFPPGTFNGEIVVCDRGTYGRIEKGRNVLDAGAGGMILANTQAQGESVNGDQHCLPAMHIGADDGDRIRDWLSSGSGHQGRLTGTQRVVDDDFGGRLNTSSSRGPSVGATDTMKPNITAPGTDIIAAGAENANSIAFLTGTSMSSPHVAGAVLLLRRSHPDWGPDQIFSALETTANPQLVTLDDGTPASTIERGAGGMQVDRASRIGLFLPVGIQAFLDADPVQGGVPGDLNLPGIVSDFCLNTEACTFTRTLQALGTGDWTVTTEGPLDVQVSPSSFSLAEDQQITLTVSIRQGTAALGAWGTGSVLLTPAGSQFVEQRLPVGAYVGAGSSPGPKTLSDVDSNRGRDTIMIDELGQIDEMLFRTSALVEPERRTLSLRNDPSPFNPFDNDTGVDVRFFDVPEGTLLLDVQTLASGAQDVDLYVGRDFDFDGEAFFDEIICESTTPDDLESCQIETPTPGRWWVLVQNWEGSAPGVNDTIPYEFAMLEESLDPSLVVSGPGTHAGGPLSLPLYWDQPAMEAGERWVGAVGVSSSPDRVGDAGVIPVSIRRTGPNTPQVTPLFEGKDYTLVIPPQTEHDLAFIDVPSSAATLTVQADGPLTGMSLRRLDFSMVGTPVQPQPATEVAVGSQASGTWTVAAPPSIQPGRYFVVMDNATNAEAQVTVTAEVGELNSIQPQRGLWSPRDRLINQGIEYQVAGSNAFVTWYTYDEDGLATFYISNGAPAELNSSYFSQPIYRVTSNGIRQTVDVVGEIQVTALDEEELIFAWRLNGYHGAEIYTPDHNSDCPLVDGERRQLLGHWFPAEFREGGVTLLYTAVAEAWVRYFFDVSGQPRWVFAGNEVQATIPGAKALDVLEFRGWCIYCEETDITNSSVGVLERVFDGLESVREVLSFEIGDPIDTDYATDRTLSRLSNIGSCPN